MSIDKKLINEVKMRKAANEITKDPVILRILEELQKQGRSGRELERELGIANGVFTKWKYQNSKSYTKYLPKIAFFLNVTPEYLCGEPDNPLRKSELSDLELKMIELLRRMDTREQRCILETAEHFADLSDLKKRNELYSKKYNNNETETTKTGGGSSEEDEPPLS